MATPSLAMIPSAYADSKVYSVLPNNGDGDFTFNRDSSATRVGPNGLIQTVGYFGSELVTNGDFATDSDWTKETGWTISGGTANFSGGTGNKAMYQAVGITNGKTYKIQYQVSSISAGQVAVRLGGMAGVDEITATTIGTYTGYITATGSANGNIHIEDNNNNFVGSIDNVSVQEVLGDQPRLNYDISNGVVQSCPSLLLEPASTNKIIYSNQLSQWGQTNVTVVNDSLTSPDGTINASKITDNSTNGNHRLIEQNTTSSSGEATYSIFLKKGTMKTAFINLFSGGTIANADVNLETGTITSGGAGSNHKIENYGDDWYRVSITGTLADAATYTYVYLNQLAGYVGNEDFLYAWGGQLEELSYSTSIIPTNGSSQTRAAETCNDAGNAATFNDSEGVLYAEISALDNSGDYRLISLSDGTTSNRLFIGFRLNTGYIYYYVIAGGVSQSNFDTTITSANSFSKIALKYKANDFALWVNGVEIYADSSGSIASGLDTLQFADGNVTNRYFYGNCKDIRVYNEALTDAQLQTLTTL